MEPKGRIKAAAWFYGQPGFHATSPTQPICHDCGGDDADPETPCICKPQGIALVPEERGEKGKGK